MSATSSTMPDASFGVSPGAVLDDRPSTSQLLKLFNDRLAELTEKIRLLDVDDPSDAKMALDVKVALDAIRERLSETILQLAHQSSDR
jgi:hypothetical protein